MHTWPGILVLTGLAAPATAQVLAFGMDHTPEGGAQLALTGAGTLRATSLAASGDGVSIDLGQFDQHELRVSYVEPWSTAAGLDWSCGLYGGTPPAPLATLSIEDTGAGTLAASADFSGIGSFLTTIEVRNNGYLVFSASGLASPSVVFLDPSALEGGTVTKQAADPCDNVTICPLGPTDLLVEGTPVTGDEIRFAAEAIAAPAVASTYRVLSNGGEMEIEAEAISLDGLPPGEYHLCIQGATMGGVVLANGASALAIGGLSSSGQDGVSIELAPAQGATVSWEDPWPLAAPGASLLLEVRGSVGGGPEEPLASICHTYAVDSFFDLDVDIPISGGGGSGPVRVQVLDQGTLVADLPGLVDPVIRSSNGPRKCGKLGGTIECLVACNPVGTLYLVNGTAYTGNEIRILAEGLPVTVDSKTRLELRGTDLPGGLVLLGVATDPLPWTSFGPGIPGAVSTPRLTGSATPQPGGTMTVSLSGGLPTTLGLLLGGTMQIDAPVFGGVLHPLPVLLLPVATDAAGGSTSVIAIPPTAPAGLPLILQIGLLDPAAPAGVSATNGVASHVF